MSLYKKNVLVLIVFCTLCWITQQRVFARNVLAPTTMVQQSFRITPIIQDLQLTAGKPYTFPLYIENLSTNPSGIHAEVSGLDQESLPDDLISPNPPSLVSWTTLSQTDFIIPPHGTYTLSVTVRPPLFAKDSGYYEAISFTPFISSVQSLTQSIILSKISALVFATIGTLNYSDIVRKVLITDFSPNARVFLIPPQSLSFSVSNTYFTHITASPHLIIQSLFANRKELLLDEKHILPNGKRIWMIPFPLDEFGLFYQATLAVSIGNGEQVTQTTWFFVLPFVVLLGCGVFLGVLLLFIQNRDKNY